MFHEAGQYEFRQWATLKKRNETSQAITDWITGIHTRGQTRGQGIQAPVLRQEKHAGTMQRRNH